MSHMQKNCDIRRVNINAWQMPHIYYIMDLLSLRNEKVLFFDIRLGLFGSWNRRGAVHNIA